MTQTRQPVSNRAVLLKMGFLNLLTIALERLFSVHHFYVAKINLKKFNPDSSGKKAEGGLQRVQPDDFLKMTEHLEPLSRSDRRELLSRMIFYNNGFHSCYCIKVHNEIACIQWLIEPEDNDIIRQYYRNQFYPLRSGQVIVDDLFTFPKYRGRGYLHLILSRLLCLAKDRGYTTAMTYIRKDKISILNDFLRTGFKLTTLLREIKIFGFAYRNL